MRGKLGRPGIALWLALGASVGLARAQAPPIRGDGGDTQFFQGRAFRTFSQFTIVDRMLLDGKQQPNPQNRRVFVFAQPFAFNLAPLPGMNITVVTPFVAKRRENFGAPGSVTARGLGDISVAVKYRFFQRLGPEMRTNVAVLGGVKLPTGPTGARDSTGTLLPIPAQVGTGSTDLFLQGSLTYQDSERGYGLYADLRYTFKNEGKSYAFGDTVDFGAGLQKRLYPWRYLELEGVELYTEVAFQVSHAARDRSGGLLVASSGGDRVFWAPGISAILKQQWLVEASFQFPITQQLNGTQLAQGWNVLFGTRIIY